MSFISSHPTIMPEEVLSEYLMWLRRLDPNLLPKEKQNIIDRVKTELEIDKIFSNLETSALDNLLHLGKGNQIIENLSIYLGYSLEFICPPVTKCLFCLKVLTKNNPPSQVVVHTVNGPRLFSKYIYRCRGCKMTSKKTKKQDIQQDVYYHPDKVWGICPAIILSYRGMPTTIFSVSPSPIPRPIPMCYHWKI